MAGSVFSIEEGSHVYKDEGEHKRKGTGERRWVENLLEGERQERGETRRKQEKEHRPRRMA